MTRTVVSPFLHSQQAISISYKWVQKVSIAFDLPLLGAGNALSSRTGVLSSRFHI